MRPAATAMRELVALTGAQRFGKSTKLRDMLRSRARVLVVDAKFDTAWDAQGYQRVGIGGQKIGPRQQISNALARGWSQGFRLIYTPPAGATVEGLDFVSHLLLAYAKRAPRIVPVTLAIDEMAFSFSRADAERRDLLGFKTIILQAGYLEIEVIGATQRPQDVATLFRDNCERTICFALHDEAGRGHVLRKIGREHEAAFRGLKRFEYLEFFDGQARKGRTKR